MTAHKTDSHARGRPKGQRSRAPKEEATFDTELQRYVMPSERRVTTPKQSEN
jgi:hypothetical protein